MTIVTAIPNNQVFQDSTNNVGGAPDRIAALTDADDATYVEWNTAGDLLYVEFDTPVIPAGAFIKRTLLRVTVRKGGGDPSAKMKFTMYFDPLLSDKQEDNYVVTWNGFTPVGLLNLNPPVDTDMANIRLIMTNMQSRVFRISEASLDVTYVAQPVVDSVDTPTGTVTDNTEPTVTWQETLDIDGGLQSKYQVKVFSAAQYGAGGFDPDVSAATYDSGELEGTSQSHTVTALPDGTYRAYVKVAQDVNTVDHWSDWDYSAFVINVLIPDPPGFTATPDSTEARIRLDITDAGGATTVDLYEVQHSTDGTNWEDVRTLEDNGRITNDASPVTIWDYESPNGVTTQYRARAVHSFAQGESFSDWSVVTAAWESPYWWLKHPLRPSLNMIVTPRSQPSITQAARQGVTATLGRSAPVVTSDVRGADEGEWVMRSSTESDRDRLRNLLDQNVPLLLQGPEDVVMWRDHWLAIGDATFERAIDASWGRYTFDSLPWVEVDRPTGAIVSWPSGGGLFPGDDLFPSDDLFPG